MEFAVTLRYPNGRTYETVIDRDRALALGTEFEMHGHTWRVAGLLNSKHKARLPRKDDSPAESTRVLCVYVR
jgi:hypothetical protein